MFDMIKDSVKQILRTPVKAIMFLALMIMAGLFLSLGGNIWLSNNANIANYEDKFKTIGTMEQRENSITQEEVWDAEEKAYQIWQRSVYSRIIPVEEVTLPDVDYIEEPEKRAYYGSYSPEYELEGGDMRATGVQQASMVVEFSPIEDCIPAESVQVEIKKVIYGYPQMAGMKIWFCEHSTENPQMLYSNKTYIARITRHGWQHGKAYEDSGGEPQGGLEYCPGVPSIDEYNVDGFSKKDLLEPQENYYEVTEDFYETDIGKRYLEIGKSLPMMEYIHPVTGTNKTLLLMPFYNKEAFISTGRDISDEEYAQGEKVCLIPKSFAKANNLTIGDMVNTHFYYTNENDTAAYNFGTRGDMRWRFDLVGVDGVYSIFEEAKYKIVGIYETAAYTSTPDYSMGGDEIVVPMKSIKNRDSKNIVDYGPMRGSNTSFQIPNGTTPQFMAKWEEYGNEDVEITFYDMGYSQLQNGIKNMKSISLLLLVIGLLMVVSILLFYSNIFITKQQGRTATLRCLGISKAKCRVALLSGLMMIIIIGSIAGSSLGAILSRKISTENMSNDYYSSHYSNISAVDNDGVEMGSNGDIILGMLISSAAIIVLGFAISCSKINRSLTNEPMQLLNEKREE